jgi:hypothetical protein
LFGKQQEFLAKVVFGGLATTLLGASLAFPSMSSAQRSAAPRNAQSEYNLASTVQIQGIFASASLADQGKIVVTLLVPPGGPDDDGEEWTIDFGDTQANELTEAGIRFIPGVDLIIAGNPHRNKRQNRVLANAITMPDGSSWSR